MKRRQSNLNLITIPLYWKYSRLNFVLNLMDLIILESQNMNTSNNGPYIQINIVQIKTGYKTVKILGLIYKYQILIQNIYAVIFTAKEQMIFILLGYKNSFGNLLDFLILWEIFNFLLPGINYWGSLTSSSNY